MAEPNCGKQVKSLTEKREVALNATLSQESGSLTCEIALVDSSVSHWSLGSSQKRFLSLGETLSEIHAAVSKETNEIFRDLVARLVDEFAPRLQSASERKVLLLFGNLAHLLARKFAISKAEIALIPENQHLLHLSESENPLKYISIPARSVEAFTLLRSQEFEFIIKRLLIARRFNLDFESRGCLALDSSAPKHPERRKRLRDGLYIWLQGCLSHLTRSSKVTVEGTYLGRLGQMALELSVGQFPSLRELRVQNSNSQAKGSRQFNLRSDLDDGELVYGLMKILIPWSLDEGEALTLERARKLGFSDKARVCFTASSFYVDDEFKSHTASILHRTKLVIGQHGAGYGSSKWEEICPEFEASDLILSWGWQGEKVLPFGMIKPGLARGHLMQPNDAVIVMKPDMNCLFEEGYARAANQKYLSSVVNLCEQLEKQRVKFTVRFHASTSSDLREAIEDAISSMAFGGTQERGTSFEKVTKSDSLVVFTYDSTGMLEMAAAGKPFFCFLPEGIDLVKEEFRANYAALQQGGMLSSNSIEAANQISTWIHSPEKLLQERRISLRKFAGGLTKPTSSKIWKLRNILLSQAY